MMNADDEVEDMGAELQRSVLAKYRQSTSATQHSNAAQMVNEDPKKIGLLTEYGSRLEEEDTQYQDAYFWLLFYTTGYPGVEFWHDHLKPEKERLAVNRKRQSRKELVAYLRGNAGTFNPDDYLKGEIEDRGKSE